MVIALVCVLANLWGSFASALCQGLGWFKRLALIGLLGVVLRLGFGGVMTWKFQTAEVAALASAVAVLANLALLFWRKELVRHEQAISPWDREFGQFLVVSAACVGGTYFFTQGDLLVVQRFYDLTGQSEWNKGAIDAYTSAGLLARALPMVVAPMLTVLFTHRSAQHSHSAMGDHLKFLGLVRRRVAGGGDWVAGAAELLRGTAQGRPGDGGDAGATGHDDGFRGIAPGFGHVGPGQPVVEAVDVVWGAGADLLADFAGAGPHARGPARAHAGDGGKCFRGAVYLLAAHHPRAAAVLTPGGESPWLEGGGGGG